MTTMRLYRDMPRSRRTGKSSRPPEKPPVVLEKVDVRPPPRPVGRERQALIRRANDVVGTLIGLCVKSSQRKLPEVTHSSAAALSLIYGLTQFVDESQVTAVDRFYRDGYSIPRDANTTLDGYRRTLPREIAMISLDTAERTLNRIADLWDGNYQSAGAYRLREEVESYRRRRPTNVATADLLQILYDAVTMQAVA